MEPDPSAPRRRPALSNGTSDPGPSRRAPRRIDAVDFWRGVVLCTIFVNHVPGNVFERFTSRNFGFSDSAEAFVFLSGLSLALAYGPRLARLGHAGFVASLARRAARLYGVHLFMSLAGLAIFAAGAAILDDSTLLDAHGRDLFVEDPGAALVGLVALGHQLGYFNILPLYIVLMFLFGPMLWIGQIRPMLMIGGSGLLYLVSRAWGLNIPTWPMKGGWFLDPFTWQLLMAIGVVIGLAARRAGVPHHWILTALATGVAFVGLFSVTDGFSALPGFSDWVRTWADLDKTVLGLGRLLHFLAIAYLIDRFRVSDWCRALPIFQPLCRLGRNSLWIFAFLSLLAAMGQVLVSALGTGVVADILVVGGGLALMHIAVVVLEGGRPVLVRLTV